MTMTEISKMFTVPMSGSIVPDFELVIPPVLVSENAKTVIDTNFENGIRFTKKNIYGVPSYSDVIIPHIKDIQVINNKVVIVLFKDDTKEKAFNANKWKRKFGIQ